MPEEKSSNRTPIMVSIQLHERLNTMKEQLRKIIGKKTISMEKTIEVLLTAKPVDLMLQDMILEAYPTIIKEPSRKQQQIQELEQWVIETIQTILEPNQVNPDLKNAIHQRFEQFLLIQSTF